MSTDEIRILAETLGPMLRDFVAASMKPIADRVAALEAKGKDAK